MIRGNRFVLFSLVVGLTVGPNVRSSFAEEPLSKAAADALVTNANAFDPAATTADEAEGKFNDDGPGLPSVAKLDQVLKAHPVPADCDPEAWKLGINQALSGRRYINLISNHVEGTHHHSPTRPERLACSIYDPGRNILGIKKKNAELEGMMACCLAAYGEGEKTFIEDLLGPYQNSTDPEVKRCVWEFGRARTLADQVCEYYKDMAKTHNEYCKAFHYDSPTRYLGCFHFGFAYNMSHCDVSEGKTFQTFLQTSGWAIAITRSKAGSVQLLDAESMHAVSAQGGDKK